MQEVAVGIIMNDGMVLACQRKRSSRYPLKWEFPGGKIEPGETAEHALTRELHEELSIDAVVGREFFRQEWIYPDGTRDLRNDGTFRVFYFMVDGYDGELKNNAFEQIAWVTPATLRTMDILEGNSEAVERLAHQTAAQDNTA